MTNRYSTISVHVRLTPDLLAHGREICQKLDLSTSLSHADIVRMLYCYGLQIAKGPDIWGSAPPEHLQAIIDASRQLGAEPPTPAQRLSKLSPGPTSQGEPGEPAEPSFSELAPASQELAQEIWANAKQRPAPRLELQRHLAWLQEQPASEEHTQAQHITTWMLKQFEQTGSEAAEEDAS